jgi:hypothetical protein
VKPFIPVLLMLALAGCATPTPAPQTGDSAAADAPGTRPVPVGQPRRLSDAEAAAAMIREPGLTRDLARVEAVLRGHVPEGGAADIMMFDANENGWRCGRVRFANPGGAYVPFAVRLDHDPAEARLGRDAASLEQVRAACSR